ncbi:unnamed protein product, partial [Prorocentrum cordatum]
MDLRRDRLYPRGLGRVTAGWAWRATRRARRQRPEQRSRRGTSLIVTLLTLPAWPIWNRNPLEFLPAADKEKAAKKDRQQGGRLLWKGQKRLRWQEEQQGELRRGRPERWQQPPCSPETAPLPARALRPCRPSPARMSLPLRRLPPSPFVFLSPPLACHASHGGARQRATDLARAQKKLGEDLSLSA